MHVDDYTFGRIVIDGVTFEKDVVIEGAEIRSRKKKPSKVRQGEFGHTPLTAAESIPWSGRRLWIGTGAHGRLPVTEDVRSEAERRHVELVVAPTPEIVERINAGLPPDTNVILHLTC